MIRILAVAALSASWPVTALASFGVTVSGDAVQISPPPADATRGSLQPTDGGMDLYATWFESAGNIPVGGLDVDHDGRLGSFSGDQFQDAAFVSDLATTLAAGTPYRSYIIHFDPIKNYTVPSGPVATFAFDHRIIGMSLFGPSLDAGDLAGLGAAGTLYPTGLVKRGLDEANNKDQFTVSAFGNVLTVDLTANGSGFDQLRVFTTAPELGALTIWLAIGIVILAAVLWRRRKRPTAVGPVVQ